MKESQRIHEKCMLLGEELIKCLHEAGFLGRFKCIDSTRRLRNCTLELVSITKLKIVVIYFYTLLICYCISSKDMNITKNPTEEEKILIKTGEIRMLRSIPIIENSFDKQNNYPSVTERYYNKLYFLSKQGPPTEHHCVLVHSNKICLIALALSHPIIREKKKIIKLDFQVSNKLDRLENKVSGKGKKGGQQIMPDSALCFVECEDGSKYTIYGCIKGKLLEINQLLLKDPNVIVEKPLSQGFVAIILPSIKDLESYKNKLLTPEKYENEILSCNKL